VVLQTTLSLGLETSRDSFFKVLVFWLFLVVELVLVNERRTFVGRGHKVLFSNLCCVLIVESLNGDQLYLDHYY